MTPRLRTARRRLLHRVVTVPAGRFRVVAVRGSQRAVMRYAEAHGCRWSRLRDVYVALVPYTPAAEGGCHD